MPTLKTMRPLIYIPLLFLAQLLYGQKSKPVPPHLVSYGRVNNNCVKIAKLPFASRIKKYPFNLSGQIQFIAFDGSVRLSGDGEVSFVGPDPGLIEAGAVDTTNRVGMREIRSLTLTQIDTLTGILYNYGFAGPLSITSTNGCYIPRNAIIFRDSNGKAFAFIEICFECRNTRQSSDKISLGEKCDQKLGMLKDLFGKVGIRHGIDPL
jgi:hypothetical protein